jgi:hypothetical protein
MIKFLIVIILMVPGLLYLGCASQPASLREKRIIDQSGYYDQVREGTSTKQDVKALFGEPFHVFVKPSGETWAYHFKNNNKNNNMMFVFTHNGIVKFKSSTIGLGSPRSVTRHTDRSRCIICGQPAVYFNDARGSLCRNHIPKSETRGVNNDKGKRSPSEPDEED